MRYYREIMVFAIICIFIGASVVQSIANANDKNDQINTISDRIFITSPNNGTVCSGNVLISWWTEDLPDIIGLDHCFNVYCGGQLIAYHISNTYCYWNSESISNGPCNIRVDELWFTSGNHEDAEFCDSDTVEVTINNIEDPWILVLSPNGGESYEEDVLIIWSYNYPFDCIPFFDIYYKKQGGSWILFANNLEGPGSGEVTTSALWETTDRYGYYKIKIDMKHCNGGQGGEVVDSDTSDGWFFIGSPDPPVACYDCSNDTPEVDQLVTFDGSCSYDPDGGTIDEYYWYYILDGTGWIVEIGYGETIEYSWNESGAYLVTLEVTDDEGVKDHEIKTIFVGDGSRDADLNCSGDLSWSSVEPGGLVTGNFTVQNVGETGSLLDWKVESHPSWGNWTFSIDTCDELPAGDIETVEVFVVAPDVARSTFSGEIIVMNKDNSSDYDMISVSLSTPKNKVITNTLFQLFEKLLQNNPNLFLLIRNIINI